MKGGILIMIITKHNGSITLHFAHINRIEKKGNHFYLPMELYSNYLNNPNSFIDALFIKANKNKTIQKNNNVHLQLV